MGSFSFTGHLFEIGSEGARLVGDLPVLWPPKTLAALPDHGYAVFGLRAPLMSPDQFLVIDDAKTTALHAASPVRRLGTAKVSVALATAITEDGMHAVITFEDGLVRWISMPLGEIVWEKRVGKDDLVAAAIGARGHQIAVGSEESLYLLDLESGETLASAPSNVVALAFIDGDAQLAVLGEHATLLHRLLTEGGTMKIQEAYEAIITAPFAERRDSVVVSAGLDVTFAIQNCHELLTDSTGRWLAACDQGLTVYDVTQQRVALALSGHCPPQGAEFDDRGGIWVSTAWFQHRNFEREATCGIHHIPLPSAMMAGDAASPIASGR